MINRLAVIFLCGAVGTGCSLKVPETGTGINIVLEESRPAHDASPFALFAPMNEYVFSTASSNILAAPTNISEFNCFAVNVTGSGISPDNSAITGCTSGDNFKGRGPGLIDGLFARNESITLGVPSGKERHIDIFGMVKPNFTGQCEGGSGGGGGTDINADPNEEIYFLGRRIVDILESSTVLVPISFTAGSQPSLTCKEFDRFNPTGASDLSGRGFDVGCVADVSTGPAPGGGAEFAGADYTGGTFSSQDSSSFAPTCSADTSYGVVEFVWKVSSLNLGQYDRFSILWYGLAGVDSSGGCAPPDGPGSGDMPSIQVWNESSGEWEFQQYVTYATPGLYVVSRSNITSYLDPSGNITIRITSGKTSTSECAMVETDFAELRLHYAHTD